MDIIFIYPWSSLKSIRDFMFPTNNKILDSSLISLKTRFKNTTIDQKDIKKIFTNLTFFFSFINFQYYRIICFYMVLNHCIRYQWLTPLFYNLHKLIPISGPCRNAPSCHPYFLSQVRFSLRHSLPFEVLSRHFFFALFPSNSLS